MIDILECKFEDEVTETPIFEIKGTYCNEIFHCKVELRFNLEEEDQDQLDYEHIDSPDLGPMGFDALEELVNEVFETEAYQEAVEDFEKVRDDLEALFD